MAEPMRVLKIQGGKPLNGVIPIAGAKNAILPLMAATLLTDRPVEFENVPRISDVDKMVKLLQSYGVEVEEMQTSSRGMCLHIRARNIRHYPSGPNAKIGQTFRASLLVLGPLLVRCKKARVYRSGGDQISLNGRGDDFHTNALVSMGASLTVTASEIVGEIPGAGLQGKDIVFPKVSVSATQNIMMAACAARGPTTIEEASLEPETKDLVKFLQNIGANTIVVDESERKYTIQGKPIRSYCSAEKGNSTIRHTVILDRIEAATYAIAAVITGGKVELIMDVPDDKIIGLLEAEFWRLLASGVQVTRTGRGVLVKRRAGTAIKAVSVKTRPFPGFPTDLHSQWAALMCFSNGQCWIEENIFDDRFSYVRELQRMGAGIWHTPGEKIVNINGQRMVHGGLWHNNDVTAGDIRAGAALILAALAKNELTVIRGVEHIERGYENFVGKFRSCGAEMELTEE